jgi:hypothetical protein
MTALGDCILWDSFWTNEIGTALLRRPEDVVDILATLREYKEMYNMECVSYCMDVWRLCDVLASQIELWYVWQEKLCALGFV